MGASSAHQRGVNVLMLDGAVRLIQPKIDRAIWQGMASIPEPANSANPRDAAK
jgi:prepilin-type processing-associated H-X9-DG protein